MINISEFRELCIRNCINFNKASKYKSRHKLTEEETIRDLKLNSGYTDDTVFSLEDYCSANNLDIDRAKEYIEDIRYEIYENYPDEAPSMTLADFVIQYVKYGEKPCITDLCQGANVSIARFKGVKRKNPDWTDAEILLYCMTTETSENVIYSIEVNNITYNLKELCELLNINYKSLRDYKKRANITYEEALLNVSDYLYMNILGKLRTLEPITKEIVIEEQDVKTTFKEKCKQAGIPYETARVFKSRHPEVSDELIIKKYKSPDKLTFKDKCDIAGIKRYKTAIDFRNNHPELTDEQVIKIYSKGENK